jgi:hypothetical protein
MLQALKHNKISRYFTTPPWYIEDLLTSVVFGSCEYTELEGWRHALRPFLAAACAPPLSTTKPLTESLPTSDELESIEYEFWPSMQEFSTQAAASISSDAILISRGIPEVIIRLKTKQKRVFLLLIEVKLNIGKSGGPAENRKIVGDQLAKYWRHLEEAALRENSEPLALIYVTAGTTYPEQEIEESRKELLEKLGEQNPPIYWVSWRRFVPEVEKHLNESGSNLPKILGDTISLLRDQWGFFYEEIRPWPAHPYLLPPAGLNHILKAVPHLQIGTNSYFQNVFSWMVKPRWAAVGCFTGCLDWHPFPSGRCIWLFSQ